LKDRKTFFEGLVRDHASELYRFAFWQTGDEETAEDLVQEAFLEAWRSLDRLRHPERSRAWIMQILRHRFAHWIRRKARRPNVVSDRIDVERSQPSGPTPATDIDRRLDLEGALQRIDDQYREAFLLVFLHGLSCREAAEELGVPLGTVLSRVHRARNALRKALAIEDSTKVERAPKLRLIPKEKHRGQA